MIYCIWYPSGGFGHFVNAAISMYGEGFKRPKQSFVFSRSGNSHALDLVAPKFYPTTVHYDYEFDTDFNYTVLVDTGINNESTAFEDSFNDHKVIKICYSDISWPIVSRTMIEKAMNADFDSEARKNSTCWQSSADWAVRENYFLFLRDHHLRPKWKPNTKYYQLFVDDIIDYQRLIKKIRTFNINIDDFSSLHQEFINTNNTSIKPVLESLKLINAVNANQEINLGYFENNLWAQSVVYYFIQVIFGFEVPHNDYSQWFTSVEEIVKMLNQHGVKLDSNQRSYC